MSRKNKKRKPSKSQNIEQKTQRANSNSSDTDSIITIDNVESYFDNRCIAIPNLRNIVLQMKENKDQIEPSEGQINDPQITPTEQQPSTSEFQANEANKDEISSDKNEKKSDASRSVRRRRLRKERLAQEQISETSKIDENPDQNQTEMLENAKTNKKTRKNARRRHKCADVNKEPEVDASGPSRATNVSDHFPTMSQNINDNESPPIMDTISICSVPASMVIRAIAQREKEVPRNNQVPDYESCDYYAYDYETLEECAEELGPYETIEITIDCTEYVPMFADYIPIRHYFENSRVVRLVERSLLDSAIPPLPLPVELLPDILTDKGKSDENKIEDVATTIKKENEEPKNNAYKDDETWFSWLDPMCSNEIKKEVITDENVAVANEAIEGNIVNAENIHIKSEIEEDGTANQNSFESKISNSVIFKSMALRIFQVEKDLKTLENNMTDFKKTMDEFKKLPFFRALEKEESAPEKPAPTQENKSVESQTETDNENQETQTEVPNQNQEKVNLNDQNTVMKISSECSKTENKPIPLSNEEINIKQFAASTKDAPKPRVRKLRKTSEILKPSLPNTDSMDLADELRLKSLKLKLKFNEEQNKRELRTKTRLDKKYFDTLQETSSGKKVEFKYNVVGNSLVASNKNEAEVDACVKKILKQLKEKSSTNYEEIVITQQPRAQVQAQAQAQAEDQAQALAQPQQLQQIKKLKTIQEINNILAKRRATEATKKLIEKRHKFSSDPEKIDYRDVLAEQKQDIEDKLNAHEFCTCTNVKLSPSTPHLCIKGHRLCFSKNENVTNEEVAISAAEWSYLLKLGLNQDEAFYRELLAKNTIEDAVIFLRHVEDEFIANGVSVSSIPALRIESDREYEVDENDPAIRRAELIRQRTAHKRE